MPKVTLTRMKSALQTLYKGYRPDPSELERDGLIQRFEYCLETCWKTSRKIMLEQGLEIDTPKNVIREMANLGWIDEPEKWMRFIEQMNKTSHIYNDDIAAEVFSVIPSFIEESKKLLASLEKKSNDSLWTQKRAYRLDQRPS